MPLELLGLGVTSRFSQESLSPCLTGPVQQQPGLHAWCCWGRRVAFLICWGSGPRKRGMWVLCSWRYPRSFSTGFLLHREWVHSWGSRHCPHHPSLSRWYHFEIMVLLTFVSSFPKPSDTGLPKHLPSVSYFLSTILNTNNVGALRLPVWAFTWLIDLSAGI